MNEDSCDDDDGVCGDYYENDDDLDISKLDGKNKIAITAGASAPERRVQEIASAVQKVTGASIQEHGEDNEDIFFKLPPSLR